MSSILSKLIRMAQKKKSPIIIYDSQNDRAGVLMDFDLYEKNYFYFDDISDEEGDYSDYNEEIDIENDTENDKENVENVEAEILPKWDKNNCTEENCEEKEFSEDDDMDLCEESNKELALWKSKREEKEREEIAKVLEEELLENPPRDPFEEDFVRNSEWHDIVDTIITQKEENPLDTQSSKNIPPKEQEPSYHPVTNSAGSLSWSDWTNLAVGTPIPYKNIPDIILQDEAEVLEEGESEAVFLEEPI